MSAKVDGWMRRVTATGTCRSCGRTDIPVGAGGRLLSHTRDQLAPDGRVAYRVRCYWTGRKAHDVRNPEDATPDSLESSPVWSGHREGPVSTGPLPACARPCETTALDAVAQVLAVHRHGPHVDMGLAALILDALSWPRTGGTA